MRSLLLYLFIILRISVPLEMPSHHIINDILLNLYHENVRQSMSPMEALDLVKERYAANFDKVQEATEDIYYYKLAFAEYYLVYEGETGTERDYLIHLYEFVVDEPETGLGHTVTYGWYTVDRVNGSISEKTDNYDLNP